MDRACQLQLLAASLRFMDPLLFTRENVSTLLRLTPVIGHVQIALVPLRNEPGTEELDDFRVLQELESLGYTGFVGCEYRPAGNAVEGLGWLKRFESGSSQD